MADTKIQWSEVVWNPATGCDRISPGCDHCYALTMAKRLKAMGQPKYQTNGDPRTSGPGFGVAMHEDALDLPWRWRKPRMVFVNSMSDLGHARIPREFQARVWATMNGASKHTYQVLSKRPERLRRFLEACAQWDGYITHNGAPAVACGGNGIIVGVPERWPLPNVWVGTSIESDDYTRRADELRATPAAVRFLSLEPLLGPLPSLDLTGIDWVIIGGESGGGARPMDVGWVLDLMAQCREAGAAVFIKQAGSVLGRAWGAGSHGEDWDFWPTYLRIREFPQAREAIPA
jgi:protein gp37